ncbi:MAG TPA: ribonuclease III [Patescibacteria group bacterium]|nr:ribonuclease III [Patescibacteria group bacterium]
MLKANNNLDILQKKIGISFSDKTLLNTAFVHRSYLNEHKKYKGPSNERLEFLGDAALSIVVSSFLYEKLPNEPEGKLTTSRAALVRTETLAKIAKSLSLGKHLVLSKGEEDTGGRENPSILANTFEALVGAIYLDQGIDRVGDFLKKTVISNWKSLIETAVPDNKSRLQEFVQRKYHVSPIYKLISSWGPDHARQFEIGVFISEKNMGRGTGNNKQSAAQNAARDALTRLKS